MNLTTLGGPDRIRDTVTAFSGIELTEHTTDGSLSDGENTSDEYYPFLTIGGQLMELSSLSGKCLGLLSKDKLCAIVSTTEDGGGASKLYYGGADTGIVLTDGEKQMVSMGTKVLIFPDKAYFDTYSGQGGSLESYFVSAEGVTVRYALTSVEGAEYGAQYSLTPPENPADGTYWCDTTCRPSMLKIYSAATESWSAVESTLVKISYPNVGNFFNEGDGIEISGSLEGALNGYNVVKASGDDFIVVQGTLEGVLSQSTPLSIERRVPNMDFVTEWDNRLWGCRFGLNNDGVFVNEIYASKLGDPFNFHCFEGISTDSYTASVGADGPFTGAVSYLGNAHFFKENTLFKIFGTRPSNFQITSNSVRGVEKGSPQSLCVCDEVLYYKSKFGIMAYDGALPYPVDRRLGGLFMKNVKIEAADFKLYVAFTDSSENAALFTYSPTRAAWHKLSPLKIDALCSFEGALLGAVENKLVAIEPKGHDAERLADLFGCEPIIKEPDFWRMETGELALQNGRNCYISGVQFKMKIPRGGSVRIRVKKDGGGWIAVGGFKAPIERVVSIPVSVGRCASFKAELSGSGKVILYSIGRTLENAPDSFGGVF